MNSSRSPSTAYLAPDVARTRCLFHLLCIRLWVVVVVVGFPPTSEGLLSPLNVRSPFLLCPLSSIESRRPFDWASCSPYRGLRVWGSKQISKVEHTSLTVSTPLIMIILWLFNETDDTFTPIWISPRHNIVLILTAHELRKAPCFRWREETARRALLGWLLAGRKHLITVVMDAERR